MALVSSIYTRRSCSHVVKVKVQQRIRVRACVTPPHRVATTRRVLASQLARISDNKITSDCTLIFRTQFIFITFNRLGERSLHRPSLERFGKRFGKRFCGRTSFVRTQFISATDTPYFCRIWRSIHPSSALMIIVDSPFMVFFILSGNRLPLLATLLIQ